MQKPGLTIASAVAAYACPIAGRTVYIRRTWNPAPEDAARPPVKSVCDNQHRCIAAKWGHAACGS